jgi:hypothetical protein
MQPSNKYRDLGEPVSPNCCIFANQIQHSQNQNIECTEDKGNQKIVPKIDTMKCYLPCTLIAGWMFRIAKSQNLGEMPPIPDPSNVFVLPSEDDVKHEATWLQWPHNYGWDPRHIQRYEDIWMEMTRALHTGEKVRIIVYNRRQMRRVRNVLKNAGKIDMSQIQFYTYPTDDVWIRDNGPIFVQDQQGNMIVEDWQFNGWVSQFKSSRARRYTFHCT